VTWVIVYAVLLAALVVRVRTTPGPVPEPLRPRAGEPLWLTRLHHRLFLVLLVGPPLERLFLPGASSRRALGAVLFAAGVLLYRLAGRALGEALSPFIEPRANASLVTGGLYRIVRHPMYLSEALVAVGAPLSLGSRHVVWLAVPALFVLVLRMVREDEALARTFPEYPRYAARTKRLIPFLY
jgi:protein-S-isoprenylcysteine O-methyltransferase Ste14